jgi:hypothetical protein
LSVGGELDHLHKGAFEQRAKRSLSGPRLSHGAPRRGPSTRSDQPCS